MVGIGQGLHRGLANLRVVQAQLAILADDVLTAIGNQKIIKQIVRVVALGGHLKAQAVDVAHALGGQLFLHALEEVVKGIPGFWNVLHLVAGLLDQRSPDVVGQGRGRIRHTVIAALLFDAVVAIGGEQSGLGIFLFLGFDDIGHIDQLAGPGLQRDQLGRAALVQIGHDPTRHRRNDLLAHRRVGDDRVVDRVAARLLVIGDDFLKSDVFFVGEALDPPQGRGLGGGVGDIGPRKASGGHQPQ